MKSAVKVAMALGVAMAGACEGPPEESGAPVRQAATAVLFKPFTASPVGSWPAGVAIGDLNGDGRNDVALTTTYYFDPANDHKLHVFLQAADGTLLPRVRYSLGQRPESVDIGDVNGDGRADVVVGNFDGASIGVLLQNASGTLDPMFAYPTVNSLGVKIGDFNSDGRQDIVGINAGSRGDDVDLFLQTETGQLAPKVTYSVAHGGYDEVEVGDVNGDGRTDVVVMSGQGYGNNLGILPQLADGTMGAPTYYTVAPNVLTHGVGVGDLNGDGKEDLAVSYGGNRPSSFIARLLQNASGGLDPATSTSSYDIPEPVVVADVDNDGRKDIVVAHGGWNALGVYRQTAAGGLSAEERYNIPYASHYQPQGLAVGDINGDGLSDVVLADYNNGLVVLLHVDDLPPAVSLTAPAPGSYFTGLPLEIRWDASDNAALAGFDLAASSDGGGSFTPIAECSGLPAGARSCVWQSPAPAGAITLRVVARDGAGNQASSTGAITLVTPALAVTGPVAGESWFIGTGHAVTWTSNLPASESVRIELTRDGEGYELLAAAAPNTGAFAWDATGPATGAARVRVSWNGGIATGTSDPFSLVAPALAVTGPVAGESWFIGTGHAVTWTSNLPASESVRIELSRDGGATYEVLAEAAPNTGDFAWTATGPATADALARVSWNGGPASASSATFSLVTPTLTVVAPAAGAVLAIGASTTITWTHNLPAGETVRIELSRDGGASYALLSDAAPNSGTFPWTATGPASNDARVRVSWNAGSASSTSGAFSVVVPEVQVTAPNTAVTWRVGTVETVHWTHNLGAGAPFSVLISRDGGVTYSLINGAVSGAAGSGSHAWTVTGPNTKKARIRVKWNGTPLTQDQSDVNFTIRN